MQDEYGRKKKIGPYTLQELLGSGISGNVYRAISDRTTEEYAIKMIERKTVTPKFFSFLERELDLLQRIDHKNVVKIKDLRVTSNNYYFVFEYCNGGDLIDYRKNKGEKLTEQFTRSIVQQVVAGLNALYEINGIHRDIKEKNILLHYETLQAKKEDRPVVKLADFGFAKLLEKNPGSPEEPPMATTIVGTTLNMAPEILNFLPYSMKVDIWSLGVVVYELLCGRFLFFATNILEARKALEGGTYVIPINNKLSAEAIDFISACLQYDQKHRISWKDVMNHKFIVGNEFTPFNFEKFASANKGLALKDYNNYILSTKVQYDFKAAYEKFDKVLKLPNNEEEKGVQQESVEEEKVMTKKSTFEEAENDCQEFIELYDGIGEESDTESEYVVL